VVTFFVNSQIGGTLLKIALKYAINIIGTRVFLKIGGYNFITVNLSEGNGIQEDIGMSIPFRGNHFAVEGITDIIEEAIFFTGYFDEVKALVFFSGGEFLVHGAQSPQSGRELGLVVILKRFDKGTVVNNHKNGLRFQPIGNILKVKTEIGLMGKSIGDFIIIYQGLKSGFTNREDIRELSGRNQDFGIRIKHDKVSLRERYEERVTLFLATVK
jgi:hypothetical protein